MPETTFTNSYIESDTILETMIGVDPRASAIALKAATAESQAWYCQEATKHIDALPLRGQKWDMTSSNGLAVQTLQFPRLIDGVGVGNGIDYDLVPVVPDLVKRACLEEAIAILELGSGGRRSLQEQGVQSFTIGGKLSETFIPGFGSQGLISAQTRRYMRKFVGAETR